MCFANRRGTETFWEEDELFTQGHNILLTLSSKSIMSTQESYKIYISKFLKRLKDTPTQSFQSLILDITTSTVKSHYWDPLFESLSEDIQLFKKITYLDFTDSPLSVKQLIDCYSLFKKCEEAGIDFPIMDIGLSQAATQLLDPKVFENKLDELSSDEIKKLSNKKILELVHDYKVPIQDISKEDFIQAINKNQMSEKDFLKKVRVLDDKSLYDFWKDELNLDLNGHLSENKDI